MIKEGAGQRRVDVKTGIESVDRVEILDGLDGWPASSGAVVSCASSSAPWAILIVVVKRLVAQRGLALAVILGLMVAVALGVSLPLYAVFINTGVGQGTTGR